MESGGAFRVNPDRKMRTETLGSRFHPSRRGIDPRSLSARSWSEGMGREDDYPNVPQWPTNSVEWEGPNLPTAGVLPEGSQKQGGRRHCRTQRSWPKEPALLNLPGQEA